MPSSTSTNEFLLSGFGPPYFDHVLAEYALGCTDGNIPSHIQEVIDKRKTPEQLKWADLYLLEKFVLGTQREEVLKARLPSLRLCYRQIVGSAAYEQYLQSGEAAPLDGSVEELRADAGRLLDALHWTYAMAPAWEKLRSKCLKRISLGILIAVVVIGSAVLTAYFLHHTLVSAVLLMSLMGALGAFLSVQQRIEKIPTGQDPILTMFQLKDGWFAVHLAPLTGALFAMLLFLMFQAGLIKGSVFPDMGSILSSATEYGKLLVWGFIAGFAERLVPDTLDNLASKRGEAAPTSGGTVLIRAEGSAGRDKVGTVGPVKITSHRG